MPLSRSLPRRLLHMRDIRLNGYEREDGLMDVEAHMTDIKTYSTTNLDRDGLRAGEPLHEMWLRMTLTPQLEIVACEAAMDATPYAICPGVAPNFARLVGLVISPGFLSQASQRVRGVEGCTHLRELLQQMATVAFQTRYGFGQPTGGAQLAQAADTGPKPAPPRLNSCYAYDENGPIAARGRPRRGSEPSGGAP